MPRARTNRRGARLAGALGRLGLDDAEPFSEMEADERRADLVEIFVSYGEYANQFLTLSAVSQAECTIWQLDTQEADALAGAWLRRAKRDGRAAAALRVALNGDEYLRSLLVLGPRLIETLQWYPAQGGFRLGPWQAGTGARGHMRVVEREDSAQARTAEQGPTR